ncbi:basic salivary proline-rich protein 2-like [Ovis aries]|uniref:basic salivary proline-rich protein 2-like n=1 Tax=Ovis aries TaxID=9940 RepID=UPI0029528BFE|nr:basic salivary proline-rich protein 2-like [Ovis aries]
MSVSVSIPGGSKGYTPGGRVIKSGSRTQQGPEDPRYAREVVSISSAPAAGREPQGKPSPACQEFITLYFSLPCNERRVAPVSGNKYFSGQTFPRLRESQRRGVGDEPRGATKRAPDPERQDSRGAGRGQGPEPRSLPPPRTVPQGRPPPSRFQPSEARVRELDCPQARPPSIPETASRVSGSKKPTAARGRLSPTPSGRQRAVETWQEPLGGVSAVAMPLRVSRKPSRTAPFSPQPFLRAGPEPMQACSTPHSSRSPHALPAREPSTWPPERPDHPPPAALSPAMSASSWPSPLTAAASAVGPQIRRPRQSPGREPNVPP